MLLKAVWKQNGLHDCESCSKSFSEVRYLKNHVHTVHEGHKDYKCEFCGKSFSNAGGLKYHNRANHGGD